jgi:hypothetical protein
VCEGRSHGQLFRNSPQYPLAGTENIHKNHCFCMETEVDLSPKEKRLKVFENRVLRRLFGLDWE